MTQTIGAVMVAGGGVAGIQAALDLADSGFFVYVIEKTPGIGGAMAQLDKTFPTTDCSMCILAPYLVTAGRHPNIELITYARLESVSGEPGILRRLSESGREVSTWIVAPAAGHAWTPAR